MKKIPLKKILDKQEKSRKLTKKLIDKNKANSSIDLLIQENSLKERGTFDFSQIKQY